MTELDHELYVRERGIKDVPWYSDLNSWVGISTITLKTGRNKFKGRNNFFGHRVCHDSPTNYTAFMLPYYIFYLVIPTLNCKLKEGN